MSQVVLWDKIILRGENAMLDYRSMNTKYYFWDDGNGLVSHKNVTMTLSWNIIPNAGNLPRFVHQVLTCLKLFLNDDLPSSLGILMTKTLFLNP